MTGEMSSAQERGVEDFYIDKQSWVSHVLKDPTQCHWTLVAKNPKDKSGDYLIHCREVDPIRPRL